MYTEFDKYLTPFDLCFGRNRFQSFPNSWGTDMLWPIAKAGFYYDKEVIKCVACGKNFKEAPTHEIAEYHEPDCTFAKLFPVGHLSDWSEPCCYGKRKPEHVIAGFHFIYKNRVKEFYKWPHKFPLSRQEIARAGFYFLNDADYVQCIECKLVVGKWFVDGETPLETHLKYNPNCAYAKLVLNIFGDTGKK